MADQLDTERCSKVFKGMADPGRLRILECLCEGHESVGNISRKLDMPMRSVSHHLKQLRNAGLVTSTRKGRFILYSISPLVSHQRSNLSLKVLDFGCCRIELGRK
jgi:ArsR family transcriptional regulator